MQCIAITGPESSGKTTLAKYLAAQFATVYIPEYARIYFADRGPEYALSDIVNIAKGQLALFQSIMTTSEGKPFVFLDTWMQELRIWSKFRFGSVPAILEEMYIVYPPDLYLLCTPDLIWKPDPLRENPYDRDILFDMYEREIVKSTVPFVKISGIGAEREQCAVNAVQHFIGAMY